MADLRADPVAFLELLSGGGGGEGNVRWEKTARSRFRKIRKATGYMLQVTGFKVKG